MQGEQGSYHRTAPDHPRHPAQNQKQQHRAGRVQHHVGQVVTAGFESSVQVAVQLQGQPGERMPVAAFEGGERPADPVRCQAGRNVLVLSDVCLIVEVDERVVEARTIDEQGQAGNNRPREQLHEFLAAYRQRNARFWGGYRLMAFS